MTIKSEIVHQKSGILPTFAALSQTTGMVPGEEDDTNFVKEKTTQCQEKKEPISPINAAVKVCMDSGKEWKLQTAAKF